MNTAAPVAADAAPAADRSPAGGQGYSTFRSWADLFAHKDAAYPKLTRLSDPGTKGSPSYTGFWWYGIEQFDATGRYALAMRVHVQNRTIRPSDIAEVGYYDLKSGNKWRKIGETNAWNYQQGARLQWRPNSNEILWNDRTDDNKHYVTRVYDVSRGKIVRTLPRPIYILTPDGRYALTHDFDRATKPDIRYCSSDYPQDCVADQDCPPDEAAKAAPACTGVWRMDVVTGQSQLILSLANLSKYSGRWSHQKLWIMREGMNPTDKRAVVFAKGAVNEAWTIGLDGSSPRPVYEVPSHQTWLDGTTMLEGQGFRLYKDVQGKTAAGSLFDNGPPNAHVSGSGTLGFGTALATHDWVLADTYAIPQQFLFLYHRPSGLFVPLARLPSTAGKGLDRIDLQARTSRDGRILTIDSSYEGLGRQLYMIDIGYILDHPPSGGGGGASLDPAGDPAPVDVAGAGPDSPGQDTVTEPAPEPAPVPTVVPAEPDPAPTPTPDQPPRGVGTNLLPNPGFESDPRSDYEDAGRGRVTWAADVFYEGARSLEIVSKGHGVSRVLSNRRSVAAVPGAVYEAQAYLTTSDLAGQATLTLTFRTKDGHESTSSTDLSGTLGWTPLSVSATAPADARYAVVEIQ
ncbi:MAG TPA: hypothetical protein VJT84_01705, partial [Gaiellaceae bacterium]|nr:hypothetical protein [Gaiellaceae bacterium]